MLTHTLAILLAAAPVGRVDPLIERAVWLAERLAPDHPLRPTLPPVDDGRAPATLRTTRVLSATDIQRLESRGIVFERSGSSLVRIGRVYAVQVPIAAVGALADEPLVEWLEGTWRPWVQPTLELAAPQVESDGLAALVYAATGLEAGEGIVVGNMDTGVDIHHPGLFQADGGALEWIDEDGDGVLVPGVDTVLLDGEPQPLSYIDAGLHHSNSVQPFGAFNPAEIAPLDGVFDARHDHLYVDSNGNGQRDYGTAAGFSEGDPGYGEPLFVIDDLDGDGQGDPGERLLRLSTSKVKGIRDGSETWLRGENLIEAASSLDDDAIFHGTGSSGIVAGGHPGPGRYTGLAWAAELLLLARRGLANQEVALLQWARAQGMKVLLIEFGQWFLHYNDGSENLEAVFDAMAAEDGILAIAPSGNLGNRSKHVVVEAKKGLTDVPFDVPGFYSDTGNPQNIKTVILTVLWRVEKSGLQVEVVSPDGSSAVFVGIGSTVFEADGWLATGDLSVSPRGTYKADIILTVASGAPLPFGGWTLRLGNPKAKAVDVQARIADDVSSWNGGALYKAHTSEEGTIAWPSTADSAVSVGAYGGRFAAAGDSGPGKLRVYSGRGPRIDGIDKIDIVAPDDSICIGSGKTLGKTLTYGGYQVFGGTSGAGPHAAAGAALLFQYDPELSPEAARQLMRDGALSEPGMGDTPNPVYGHGKIRLMSAVAQPVQTLAPLAVTLEVVGEGPALERTIRAAAQGAAAWRWDETYDGAWDTGLEGSERVIAFPGAGVWVVKVEAVASDGSRGYATLELDVEDLGPPPEPEGEVAEPEPEPEPELAEPSVPEPGPEPVEAEAEEPGARDGDSGGCSAGTGAPPPEPSGAGALLLLLVFFPGARQLARSATS